MELRLGNARPAVLKQNVQDNLIIDYLGKQKIYKICSALTRFFTPSFTLVPFWLT